VPEGMRSCYGCHRPLVEAYLEHGMARSVGGIGGIGGISQTQGAGTPGSGMVVAPGEATNPDNGTRYAITVEQGVSFLTAHRKDGGTRRQQLVGHIGAGTFDTSWVGAEIDPFTGNRMDFVFFAPVETLTGHGVALSPFELHPGASGLDFALTTDCLVCHTLDRPWQLPDAGLPTGGGKTLDSGQTIPITAPEEREAYPPHSLGANAFEHLSPLGCDACHGDAARHVRIVTGAEKGSDEKDIGLPRLAALEPPVQRDVCSRCHLQGDARSELVASRPAYDLPLVAQVSILVPADPPADDFRFVGQMERLALSPCFIGSPALTCTTCHQPHTAVAAQGTASFDAACMECHDGGSACNRPPDLTVETVAGNPARTADGCVDCHVRRSQPFDLPHLRTADHHIRRHIPLPQDDIPHRAVADPAGPVALWDDGRLAVLLAQPGGERWRRGAEALGLVSLQRFEEAMERLEDFPPPGTPEARTSTAPEGVEPLETSPLFHSVRGAVLQAAGRFEEAERALSDALELDPARAGARMSRARTRLALGDVRGVLEDTEILIHSHPRASAPWDARAQMAIQMGRLDLAATALMKSLELWPSNAAGWATLARMQEKLGQEAQARTSFARARTLQPSLPGLPITRPADGP
jgi:hypothetical protein